MTLLVMQFKEGQSHAGVINVQQEKLPPVRITSASTITSYFILSRRHIVALSVSSISACRKTLAEPRREGPFHHLACGGCINERFFPLSFFSPSVNNAGLVRNSPSTAPARSATGGGDWRRRRFPSSFKQIVNPVWAAEGCLKSRNQPRGGRGGGPRLSAIKDVQSACDCVAITETLPYDLRSAKRRLTADGN